MHPCEPICFYAATQKVRYDGAGLPASLALLESTSWHTLEREAPRKAPSLRAVHHNVAGS